MRDVPREVRRKVFQAEGSARTNSMKRNISGTLDELGWSENLVGCENAWTSEAEDVCGGCIMKSSEYYDKSI